MKIFILGYVGFEMFTYDSNQGFVIIAEDEQEARKMAQNNICDEERFSRDFWLNNEFSTCKELEFKKGIVLTDFHAG